VSGCWISGEVWRRVAFLRLLLYNVLGVSESFLCFWLSNWSDYDGGHCKLVRDASDPHCDGHYSWTRPQEIWVEVQSIEGALLVNFLA
jgi:hypothetical protein